jgi:hypothetical protein
MHPHTTIPNRAAALTGAAAHRGRAALARAALALGVLGAAATGTVLAGAGPAAAIPGPAVLYAYAAGTGTPAGCPQDTTGMPANECSLAQALSVANPGDTIDLATPGATAHYVGNWSVGTAGTSATAPVTIQPAPGLASQPVLDGNKGASTDCSTTACNGPVLTVPGGEYVALSGITIANANNTATANGGGLANTGTVTITGCTFTGNTVSVFSGAGGAIDTGFNGGTGSVTVTGSTFTGNTATFGGAIESGDGGGGGTVQVAASTFTGNGATAGGAIDSGYSPGGGGSVTVTASTFTKNGATDGGAIDSGDTLGGGTVQVAASTFTANTGTDGGAINNSAGGTVQVAASTFTGNTATNGGAIDSGDGSSGPVGGGPVTVTASTFTANTATGKGNTIAGGQSASAFGGGGGAVLVAGNLFGGSCAQPGGGTWTDGGYNAGTDTTCFAASPPASDKSDSKVGSDLNALATNGGPTQTIEPIPGNPAIGLITNPATVTLGSSQVTLCPATDQRGYHATAPCDAGAVQTTGSPPALSLKDSASPVTFNAAGQVITYSYKVSNTGAGPLSGITVSDPAVPGVSCPAGTLLAGTSETCTGSYTTTSAALAAGKITDTATATAAAGGVPVTSNTATVTVGKGWPPAVTGSFRPAAGAAEGYYLGAVNNTWTLYVTHPGTTKVSFTGKVTVPAGTLGHLTLINPTTGHQVTITARAITFTVPDSGKVTGFSFTTTAKVPKITFTLNIGGHPATATQVFLGGAPTAASSGSPLTITR